MGCFGCKLTIKPRHQITRHRTECISVKSIKEQGTEMPQCLKIAERIYQTVKEKKGFTDDPLEDLNNLMIELRNAIKGTEIKLLYNYIDFAELMVNPVNDTNIKLDLSLIPKSRNSQEFILWLAGVIEKITVGAKKELPPLKAKISLSAYENEDNPASPTVPVNNGEEIIEYFKINKMK